MYIIICIFRYLQAQDILLNFILIDLVMQKFLFVDDINISIISILLSTECKLLGNINNKMCTIGCITP